jgi:NitT/TauT family transport system substrate-binding protein
MAIKLRPAQLTLKDIEPVNMGFPDMIAAFKTGAIDAAFPSAPATTQIRKDGTADYFGGVTQPGASAVGVTVGGPFLKSRPEVLRKMLMALVKGARDVQGEGYLSPENLQAYSTYTETPVETLKSMDPYEFDPELGLDSQTLQDMQQVFIAEGVMQVAQPIALSMFVDEAPLKAAVQQLGPAPRR